MSFLEAFAKEGRDVERIAEALCDTPRADWLGDLSFVRIIDGRCQRSLLW
ncbi:hypothetical protein FHX15_005988 [Rhizobium sp. BK650]|nr:hypothetical protein [Rhizobium sp. BK650]MBB3660717.1 hypothetical protein [Rhizobium sp. BK650]